MKAASWGTPDRILRGLEERRKLMGDFEMNVAFRFGGTPYEICERSLRLFAREVAARGEIVAAHRGRQGGLTGA